MDMSANENATTVHSGIAINDEVLTVISPSVMGTYIKYADEAVPLSGTIVEELNYGDTIQLQLTADDDDDVITVYHYTTTIAPFFRGR